MNTKPESTTEETLEPCPFCGAVPVLEKSLDPRWLQVKHGEYCVMALNEFGRGRTHYIEYRFRKAWNRRISPAKRPYFCSCGAACTAEEYLTHLFEMGHDRGDSPASTAPVVDESELRFALEGMIAAFDTDDYSSASIVATTRECALSVAKQAVGWPAAAAAAPVEQSEID